ncbi:flagellar export chaperone FliS [Proteocatella sphenisci]|uniref:flagellar export chaperone FliS n=1 Tax=Proteocatella sphenisci TaxID=181070 RepID=UPI0004B00B0C|nr:flagellar export chaperone FliS [Proteocatella sphenisci]
MQYGHEQYKEQSINTMTKGEQLVLLFDEVVKNLKKSEIAIEIKNYELLDESIQKSMDIVRYLISILDRSIPISDELYRMYDFFLYEFNRIKSGRKTQVVEEVKELVIEMRDAFKEADKIASKK